MRSVKASFTGRQAEDLELVRTEFGYDTLIIEDTDPEEYDCEGWATDFRRFSRNEARQCFKGVNHESGM